MSRSLPRFAAGAACIAFFALASQGRAQGGDRAVAEALFEKGRAAMDRSDFDTACAAFEESNRLDPAPGTLFNQADCEEKRGHLSSAWQLFDQTGAKLGEADERRPLVLQRAADLKARLPHLTINLSPNAPPDTRVVRDTMELRSVSLGLPLPLDPGAHQIIVSAPGRAEQRFMVEVAESENKVIVVEPGPPGGAAPVPAATPPASGPEKPSSFDKRTVGFVVGGVGVAAIGTAFVLGAVALGKKSTVEQHCNASTHTCDSSEGVDAASSGKTLTTASTVSFVVGALATGVGAYFILTSGSQGKTSVGASALPGGGFVGAIREF